MSEPVALPRHRASVTMLTFTENGRILSSSRDRTAQLMVAETRKPIAVFDGHLAAVADAAALSNDRFVTASFDGGVRFFDGATGKLTRLAKGHTSRVTALAVAPSRSRVASVSDDGSVRIWDADGNPGPVLRGHDDGAMRAYFEDDKAIVTISRAGIVATWDATNGERIETSRMATPEEKAEPARTLELAKGIVAEARDDGTVRITDLVSERSVVLGGHDDAVTALAVSAHGDLLAAGSADGAILVWRWREAWGRGDGIASASRVLPCAWRADPQTKTPDTRFDGDDLWVGKTDTLTAYAAATGKRRKSIEGRGDVAAFGKKRVLFARFNEELTVVDRKSGKVTLTVPLEGEYLRPRAGQPLAWCTKRKGGKANALRVIDPEKEVLLELGPMKGPLGSFALRSDGKRAVVASAERPHAWIWNVEGDKLVAESTWEDGLVHQLAFTHDGARVIIGTADGRVHVFDAKSGERLRELVPPPGDPTRQGWAPILVSPASDRVVAWGGDQHHAILFDATNGTPLLRLFGEEKSGWVAGGVAFSPDGSRLVAAHCARPKLVFYDAKAGTRIVGHEVHRSGGVGIRFRFFGANRVLSWATQAIDRSLRAWDVETGARLWANLGIGGEGIDAVVVSPDDRFVAVTSRSWAIVRVIDAATGKTVADLDHHQGYVRTPSFSPNSTLLATSSNDGDVQVWELP